MEVIDHIRIRQDTLSRERERLTDRLEQIEGEFAELATAMRVVERLTAFVEPAPQAQESERNPRKRDVILNVMRDLYPDGAESADIRQFAKDLYGEDINANTLTVSLVRMRKEGQVRLEGGRTWFYAGDTNVTPAETEAAPSSVGQEADHASLQQEEATMAA